MIKYSNELRRRALYKPCCICGQPILFIDTYDNRFHVSRNGRKTYYSHLDCCKKVYGSDALVHGWTK